MTPAPPARPCRPHITPTSSGQFRMRIAGLASLPPLMLLLAIAGCGHDPVSAWKKIEITDIDGKTWAPVQAWGTRVSVYFFLGPACPAVERCIPEIRRLHDHFSTNGVTFWMIHPDPEDTTEVVRERARKWMLPGVVIRDPQHRLVRLAGARTWPEAVVVNTAGQVIYQGRMDDRFITPDQERPEPYHRDLHEALMAACQDRPVANPRTAPVGCPIPEIR